MFRNADQNEKEALQEIVKLSVHEKRENLL